MLLGLPYLNQIPQITSTTILVLQGSEEANDPHSHTPVTCTNWEKEEVLPDHEQISY